MYHRGEYGELFTVVATVCTQVAEELGLFTCHEEGNFTRHLRELLAGEFSRKKAFLAILRAQIFSEIGSLKPKDVSEVLIPCSPELHREESFRLF